MIAVYILFSEKDKRTYVGSTNDIDRRITEHLNGLVLSTKHRLPVRLIYFEEFSDLSTARKKEKYYKSCAGRKKLKLIMDKLI
jgi:putative endonuclease